MRNLTKLLSVFLVIAMLFSCFSVAAEAELMQDGTTVVENDFIKVTVDNATGRFSVRTVEGQPARKKDQNVDLMFKGEEPETSFTTFRINGTDYIFGNPYKFSPTFFSEITPPTVIVNKDGSQQVETTWGIEGVSIKQVLKLYNDETDLGNAGNVGIRYEVTNNSGANVEVGSRILLDTMLASNDGPAFQIGSISENVLTVERKLTHDPVNDQGIAEEDKNYYKLPAYWVMKDTLDPTNPLATNVFAYGFNNFSEGGINIVDEIIVGHWNKLANTKWDYEINPNLDFTVDTNDYGTKDSAVAFYWQPETIAKDSVQSFETIYGLGEIIEPDSVFDIRYLDEVNQLETNDAQTEFINDGVFDINIEVENLAMYDMTHTSMTGELTLQSGLEFVETDNGHVVYGADGKPKITGERSRKLTYQKTLTVEQIDNGETADLVPGEIVPFTFKVMAVGKPWPTTREYMFTATSPQLEEKFANASDEVKALYNSSRAGFIFLPPVGAAEQTYAYALSPEECFFEDEKYITVNLSNIEAYNLGTKDSEGEYVNDTNNFNVYLKEKVTGERYLVDVQSSVLMQLSGDGKIGDMRISYRNGDKVDEENNIIEEDLGPTLPIGEYCVQIDFLEGRVEGMTKEQADLYDITTEQTFIVSENEETRIRLASILAIGKSERVLDNTEFLEYKAAKEAMSYAALAVDPEYEVETVTENTIPVYGFYTFESEEEMAEMEENEEAEFLVIIRGMIKQVGEGENASDYIVDTTTEPAIINSSIAYSGKDLVFTEGKLDIFGLGALFENSDIFNSLSATGDGTLCVASSGFVFHDGEWSIDFYDGFDKGSDDEEDDEEDDDDEDDDDDDDEDEDDGDGDDKKDDDKKEDKEIEWAVGGIGDALNPLRSLSISDVYINRKSLFSAPSFSVAGFGLKFKEFILGPDEVSFGGEINLKIVNANIDNVTFDEEGFKGIESELGFDLGAAMGLISPPKEGEDETKASGKIKINHYRDGVEGKNSEYGIEFEAELAKVGVKCELSFKKVDDGRILPDVVGFGATLPEPGFPIAGTTYLTEIRGALRELADTIAGGDGEVPLTIEAGVSVAFGVKPAQFEGEIDLTLKQTGIKLEGKLDYAGQEMLTHALIEARWVTPWFVKAEAEVNVLGWGVIIGNARIFIGENVELNRIDFEGFVSAVLQIPDDIPVVGGLQIGRIAFGLNNDKIWGSAGIGVGPIMVSVGVTYYWSGEIEIGSAGEGLPEGYTYLLVQDPEHSKQRLVVIGEGIKTVASSFVTDPNAPTVIKYHALSDGMQLVDNGNASVGVGGVDVSDGGKTHSIPMGIIKNEEKTSDAMLEVEYFNDELPLMVLNDGTSDIPVVVGDLNNPDESGDANAFVQVSEIDGVTQKKLYIIISNSDIADNAVWTLKASEKVETKLLSLPQGATLERADMTVEGNTITADIEAHNVEVGDVVNLYLTKEKLGTKSTIVDGVELVEANDAGTLIAKDVDISTGSIHKVIDLKNAELLGKNEDITALLEQGEYYLRTELKAAGGYDAVVSDNTIEVIDELAPSPVTGVVIEAAGNGYFKLSFKPAFKKAAQESFEHCYAVDVFTEEDGELSTYPNLGGIILTEDDLAGYYNERTGRYEGIRIGGMKKSEKEYKLYNDDGSPMLDENGVQMTDTAETFVGLETGAEYVVGVSAGTVPDEATEPAQNYHYAQKTVSENTLLPIPKKPILTAEVVKLLSDDEEPDKYITLVTNIVSPGLKVGADQNNIEVEVSCGDTDYGTYKLTDRGHGSEGVIPFTDFVTDGTYCIELKATNTDTGDYSVTVVYLTLDTISPFMYIETPTTGSRTENGKIAVKGMVAGDTKLLTVNGTPVPVDAKGGFDGLVDVSSAEPTVKLEFVASDAAGNQNSAAVMVTNGDFKVPSALVLRKVPEMEVGDTAQIEAFLRYPDGEDTYTETPVPQSELGKLSFESSTGDAVRVESDGMLTALSGGANIVNATFKLTESVDLTSVLAVRVYEEDEKNTPMFDLISLETNPVEGSHDTTKLIISGENAGEGYELVYKLYAKGADITLPTQGSDLSAWTPVPSDRIIAANDEEQVVVARRKNGIAEGTSNKATVVTEIYGRLSVSAEKLENDYTRTKLTVAEQNLENALLVYKKTDIAPTLEEILDGTWIPVPTDGIIAAHEGDKLVVAKISVSDRRVLLVSAPIEAICEDYVSISAKCTTVTANASMTKINVTAAPTGKEYAYKITKTDTVPALYDDASAYTVLPESGVIKASEYDRIIVVLRDAEGKYAVGGTSVTAYIWKTGSTGGGSVGGGGTGGGSTGGFTPPITKPVTEPTVKTGTVMTNVRNEGITLGNATVLGTIAVEVASTRTDISAENRLAAQVKIPDDVKVSDITSVVLVNAEGGYTPVPWKLNMVGNTAYADVSLPQTGKLVFASAVSAFEDVPAEHWGVDDINEAASKLFITGIDEKTFLPNNNITRAQFAILSLRVGGFMALSHESVTMNDVKEADWCYNALAIGKTIGLVNGDTDNMMRPNANIKRVEAMAIIGRFLKMYGVGNDITEAEITSLLSAFTDRASLPSWAEEDVAVCVKYGIIKGSNGNLNPAKLLTRVEAAAIANRTAAKIAE